MLHLIKREWCPNEALVISFKLETDTSLLETKAVAALEKYGVDAVVANMLDSYRNRCVVYQFDALSLAFDAAELEEPKLVRQIQVEHNEDSSESSLEEKLSAVILSLTCRNTSLQDRSGQAIRSDPMVDGLGPERVELCKNAHERLNLWAQYLSQAEDGGDQSLDKCLASNVIIESVDGIVPEWSRKNLRRGHVDWCLPTRSSQITESYGNTAILLLHGGANVCYSEKAYRPLSTRLASAIGVPVLCPDYRLAPEFKYPAALDDAEKCVDWLILEGYERILLVGDSSGGGLALALALRIGRDASSKIKNSAIHAILLLSPWLDMTASLPSYQTRRYNKITKLGDPIYCSGDVEEERQSTRHLAQLYWGSELALDAPDLHPLYAQDLELLPEHIYCIVGDAELILDDSRIFAFRAAKAGVPVRLDVWPRLFHVFCLYSENSGPNDLPLPEAIVALRRAARWLHHVAFIDSSTSSGISKWLLPSMRRGGGASRIPELHLSDDPTAFVDLQYPTDTEENDDNYADY